jgi:predicted nucleic acid-binding protein
VIVVDTGPVVALLNDRDDHHERCRDFLETHPGPLLVPSTVLTEVCLLLERRRGTRAELAFLADVRAGRFTLVDDLEPDLDRIAELVQRYADLPLGTVDASVIALTERLELTEVATLDHRDFSVVRPRHTSALMLLP